MSVAAKQRAGVETKNQIALTKKNFARKNYGNRYK